MTSFSQAIERDRPLRRGFTLVEMLVVVGIIVVLIGILLPAVTKAHTRAVRTRMQMDVQAIVAAMEAYRTDMRDYPHIDYNDAALVGPLPGGTAPAASNPGAVTLCSALVGPGAINVDGFGATGTAATTGIQVGAPGFTIRPSGQVYGPYVDVSRFKFVADATMSTTIPNAAGKLESTLCLADRYNHPILYYKSNINAAYRASAPPLAAISPGFVADVGPAGPTGGGSLPFYNYEDNPVQFRWPTDPANTNTNGMQRMRLMLGDRDASGWIDKASTADGLPENPSTISPYLIWSAGPDELFGFDISSISAPLYTFVSTSDDATNFSF